MLDSEDARVECPRCDASKIETESLKEKLKENAGLGAGLGLGAIALPIATLPAAIGGAVAVKLYDYIQGETVKESVRAALDAG
ncbi:MAG: hypothetical protein ABEN55_05225, partial [Bradymonadaceae bacterium]